MSNRFATHVLGCGSAKPSVRHNPSCTVLEYRGNLFMIDCGEGSQREFQRQRLKFSRLQHIFLTHLHGDHVFGLPGLVGTLALSGIEGDVVIHTFEEGARQLQQIFNYFSRDLPLNIRFDIFDPKRSEVILDGKHLRVTTLPLRHRIPTVGFLFEEKEKPRHLNREMCDFHGVPMSRYNHLKGGLDFLKPDGTVVPNEVLTLPPTPQKKYAHISDTAYMPDLAEKIRGVDLLFHESTYLADKEAKALQRGHSTAAQAAMVARDAQAGRLLLGHYSSSVKNEEDFLAEAQPIFQNSILAKEGLVLDI